MIGYSLMLPFMALQPSVEFSQEVRRSVGAAGMPRLNGPICLVVRFFPSSRNATDLKRRCDILVAALIEANALENDEQIDDFQVLRGPIVKGGRIEILMGEIDA